MTVQELVAKLREFDGGLRVMVPGFEAGTADIGDMVVEKVALDQSLTLTYGPHFLVPDDQYEAERRDHIQALVLWGD